MYMKLLIYFHLVIIHKKISASWHLIAKLLKSLPRNHPLLSTLFYLQAAPGRVEDLRIPGTLKFYRARSAGKFSWRPAYFLTFTGVLITFG